MARLAAREEGLSLRRTPHAGPPTQLQVGDRFSDETGEWEVIGRPYTSSARKIASAPVWRIARSTEIRTSSAHDRISVKRASAEEGKR